MRRTFHHPWPGVCGLWPPPTMGDLGRKLHCLRFSFLAAHQCLVVGSIRGDLGRKLHCLHFAFLAARQSLGVESIRLLLHAAWLVGTE